MRVRRGGDAHDDDIRRNRECHLRHRLGRCAVGRQCWSGPAPDNATTGCHSAVLVAGASGTRVVGGYAGARHRLHLSCHGGS